MRWAHLHQEKLKKKHIKVPKRYAIIATKTWNFAKIIILKHLQTRQGDSQWQCDLTPAGCDRFWFRLYMYFIMIWGLTKH